MLLPLRWARRLVAAVVLALVLVVLVTGGRIWWTARQDDRTATDAILVLGASQFDGRPSSVFEARLEQARRLYLAGVAPRIVTLGGSREGDRFTEAEAGEAYLRSRGVPGDALLPIGQGGDTLQSLRAAAAVLDERGWDSVTVVTDPWHALRSRTMAEDLGLDARTSPTRAGPSVRTRGTQLRYIARETAALLFYEAFGTSAESGPRAV